MSRTHRKPKPLIPQPIDHQIKKNPRLPSKIWGTMSGIGLQLSDILQRLKLRPSREKRSQIGGVHRQDDQHEAAPSARQQLPGGGDRLRRRIRANLKPTRPKQPKTVGEGILVLQDSRIV